jgi:GrpB-like predicted nucleotidyltransferase (UPF0157 family)
MASRLDSGVGQHPLGLRRGRVRLAAHEPRWAALFETEAAAIRACLGHMLIDVQHVGSTAVPALAAKPILDVAVAVAGEDAVVPAAARLATAGYVDRGSAGRNGGHLLVKETAPEVRTMHIHVVPAGDPQWDEYVRFRDVLRADAEVRQEYAQLKTRLAELHALNREAYTAAKAQFIHGVLSATGGA